MSIVPVLLIIALIVIVGGGLGYVARNEWLRRANRKPTPPESLTRTGILVHSLFVAAMFGGLVATILAPKSWLGAWVLEVGFGPAAVVLVVVGTVVQMALLLAGYPVTKRSHWVSAHITTWLSARMKKWLSARKKK
jgi:hypothetical protein